MASIQISKSCFQQDGHNGQTKNFAWLKHDSKFCIITALIKDVWTSFRFSESLTRTKKLTTSWRPSTRFTRSKRKPRWRLLRQHRRRRRRRRRQKIRARRSTRPRWDAGKWEPELARRYLVANPESLRSSRASHRVNKAAKIRAGLMPISIPFGWGFWI